MARFEFDAGGGQIFEADAPDLATAKRAYDGWKAQQAPQLAPAPDEWEREVQAAQADPRNTGFQRGARQAMDVASFGILPRVGDYAGSVADTGALYGPEQHQAYRRRQALTEASRRPTPSGGAGQWTGDVAARTVGGVAGVAALPLRAAQPVVETARRVGVQLSDDAARMMQNLLPSQTRGQAVAEGARIGASFGALGGVGTERPDARLGETLSDMGTHMVGGAMLGAGTPLAIEGVGRAVGGAQGLARRMFNPAADARARASAWDELGMEAPGVALLGPSGQARAGRLADTAVVGGGTRESIAGGVRDVEERLRSALGVTGTRSVNEAGTEAQDLTRRGLTARRTDEELSALGDEELAAISGVGRTTAPPVRPTTPEEMLARRRGGGLSERLAEAGEPSAPPPVPARPRRSLLSRLGQELEPPVARPPPVPERPDPNSREGLIMSEVETTPPIAPVPPNLPDEQSVMIRQAERGPLRRQLPDSPEQMPLTQEETAAIYAAQQRVNETAQTSAAINKQLADEIALTRRRLQEATDRQQRNERLSQPRPLWQETEVWEGGPRIPAGPPVPGLGQERNARSVELLAEQRRRWEERLAELQAAQARTPSAEAHNELHRIRMNVSWRQTREWQAAQQANEEQFTTGLGTARSAALHETQREAEIAARLQNAQRELRRVEDARSRALQEYEAARVEAQIDTIRRQSAAQAAHEQQQATQAAGAERGPSMGLPQRRESFAEQIEAGERALIAEAPTTQQPLLDQPNSALRSALDRIALAGRGAVELAGYRSEDLFSAETGRLNERLEAYLRKHVGDRITDQLQRLALQHQRGQFAQGPRGTEELLSTLMAARGLRKSPEAQRMVREIEQAVNADFERLIGQKPEGAAWVQKRRALRAVRQRIIEELENPLRTVMGTETSPAAALGILQNSARAGGDVRVLQAFLRVAEAKGDRSAAASLVLQGMAEGGLTGFLRNWRSMSPEARQLLFQGPMAPLGARLERLVAAGSTIEGVASRGGRMRAAPQIRQAITAALWGWVHLPSVLTLGVGAKAADVVLASRGFARWLQRMPPTPSHRGWEQRLSEARGFLGEAYGVNEQLGSTAASLMQQTLGVGGASAQALTLGDETSMRESGVGTFGHGKGSVQRIPEREGVGQHNLLSRIVEEIGGGRSSFERFQETQRTGQLPDMGLAEGMEAPVFRGGVRVTPRLVARVRELTEEGYSAARIAQMLRVSPRAVASWRNIEGIEGTSIPRHTRRTVETERVDNTLSAEELQARQQNRERQRTRLAGQRETREDVDRAARQRTAVPEEDSFTSAQRAKLVAMEDAMRRRLTELGQTPEQVNRAITLEINKRFQEGVTVDEVTKGLVWWRE